MADISKINLNGVEYNIKDTIARQGVAAVATVDISTTSQELYGKHIVVTNSVGALETEADFNSSGRAIAYISSYGTYTFTVTY